MGVYGNPGRYASVIGENEEDSPWEPLHVEQGFTKEESTVTGVFPNSYSQIWQYGSDDKGILDTFVYNLQPGRGGLSCFIMTPQHAKVLARQGWTKQGVAKYVQEFARTPAYRHPISHDGGGFTIKKPETTPSHSMDPMAIVPSPDQIKVLVAGGPGAFLALACGSSLSEAVFVTKRIKLPSDWSKLVAKYRSVVPVYEKY